MRTPRPIRALFAVTLFVSSALLFVVQPMFGKLLLPLVGASPAAWTTCMLFFQSALLAGYAVAHVAKVRPLVHVVLLALTVLALPAALAAGGGPPAGENPVLWLLAHLARTVGVPFVALAASAPVLQRWFPDEPYGLYAASNAGSLTALLTYPFWVERALGLTAQWTVFVWAYGIFIALVLACAVAVRGSMRAAAAVVPAAALPVAPRTIARWVALAFVPSSLMIGATTHLTNAIASIPLLWILPLALYLVSFIVAFGRPRAHPSPVAVTAFMALLLLLFFLVVGRAASYPAVLLLHLLFLLLGGLVFHRELARVAPEPAGLTRFYLALAAGGALGGLWNVVAPVLFTDVTEYPIAMVLACALLPRPAPTARATVAGDRQRELLRSVGIEPGQIAGLDSTEAEAARRARRNHVVVVVAATMIALAAAWAFRGADMAARAIAVLAVPMLFVGAASLRRPGRLAAGLAGILVVATLGVGESQRTRLRERTFFGVLRVEDDPAGQVRSFLHGSVVHGQQRLDPGRRTEQLGYYERTGPAAAVFDTVRAAASGRPENIGVIGLGCGMLAGYGAAGDQVTFFELDGAVERVARDPALFSWLDDAIAAGVDVDVVVGDARRSLVNAAPHAFDLLVVDAFSSHAIPMHLVTREAIALYLANLRPHGLIAFQITNRIIHLDAPLGALARDAGLVGLLRHDEDSRPPDKVPSTWVVLARSRSDLGDLVTDTRWAPLPAADRAWTDDFSDLASAISY